MEIIKQNHAITITFPGGRDDIFVGNTILVHIKDGCLIVTIREGQKVREYAWPPKMWQSYEMDGTEVPYVED